MSRPSLFEAAGGEPALLALATAHHARCLADDVLNHPFSHLGHPDHVRRLAWYWGEVLGGPPRYSEAGVDQRSLVHLHAHTDAQADMGDRFVACFVAALDDADIPDDPELRACLRAYMEWAAADMMTFAPRNATVPDDLVVPHWSWDGLEPVGST
jgi:hemoglobin